MMNTEVGTCTRFRGGGGGGGGGGRERERERENACVLYKTAESLSKRAST